MRSWFVGTRLVAERGLVENIRSRSFKVVTALLLLLSVAAVTLPQIIGKDSTTYTLASEGPAPVGVIAALDAAGAGGTFPVLVAQAVVTLETARRMVAAGLTPQQATELQSIQPPHQITVGRVADEGRAGVGFLVGIILYIAITFAGTSNATTVATEKSSRISDVLLAVLRPSQVLVGTVVAVGAVTLGQLLVLATPLAVAVRVTDSIGLPPVAAGDLGLAVLWFILGFALYAFLFAATAALVNKVSEVNTAIMPVTLLLLGGYFVAITVVAADPNSPWSVAASMFPFTAPLAMPIRWASGDVPAYQFTLAIVLTVVTAVLLAALGSSMYRQALLITGRRVRLREVVGG